MKPTRLATQAAPDVNQATLHTAYNWTWTSHVTSPNPETTAGSGPHNLFEYGTSTDGALTDVIGSTSTPTGGSISGSYTFSPTAMNVLLDVEAPDQNQRDPGIKDLITDPQGLIGVASGAADSQFIDYITNTSTAKSAAASASRCSFLIVSLLLMFWSNRCAPDQLPCARRRGDPALPGAGVMPLSHGCACEPRHPRRCVTLRETSA